MSGPELLLQTEALDWVNHCMLRFQSHWDPPQGAINRLDMSQNWDSELHQRYRWRVEISTWLILYLCTTEEGPFEAKCLVSSNKNACTVCKSHSNTLTRGHDCVMETWMLWEDMSTMRGHDYCKETWLWAGRHKGERPETHNEARQIQQGDWQGIWLQETWLMWVW